EPMRRLLVKMRGLQQCLRGDAADVEAGPPERAALLHARGLQAKLRRADGADIAAGSAADDDHIELSICHGFIPSNGMRFRYQRAGRRRTSTAARSRFLP